MTAASMGAYGHMLGQGPLSGYNPGGEGFLGLSARPVKKAPAQYYSTPIQTDTTKTDIPMKPPTKARGGPSQTTSTTQTGTTRMPQVDLLTIPTLNNPFKKAQAITIVTSGCSKAEGKTRVRNAWKHVAACFDSMKPFLTFKPNPNKMKCKGSYTTPDRFSTTTFEAQVWNVHPSISGQKDDMYILEFRNKSLEGREAFRDLVRTLAGELKNAGIAKFYGNGIEIYTKEESALPEPDLGELAMPSMGGALSMPSFSQASKRSSQQPTQRACPISLNETQLNIWAKILKEQKFPTCVETLKLIAQCCQNEHNLKLLAEREEVLAAVCHELQSAIAPSACLNALTIASSVLEESRDAFKTLVENGLLTAVANSLKMHSGTHKVGAVRVTRSAMIEKTALEVLKTLAHFDGVQLSDQVNREVRNTLVVLQGDLSGKLKDQSHTIELNSIIKTLRSKIQKSR